MLKALSHMITPISKYRHGLASSRRWLSADTDSLSVCPVSPLTDSSNCNGSISKRLLGKETGKASKVVVSSPSSVQKSRAVGCVKFCNGFVHSIVEEEEKEDEVILMAHDIHNHKTMGELQVPRCVCMFDC